MGKDAKKPGESYWKDSQGSIFWAGRQVKCAKAYFYQNDQTGFGIPVRPFSGGRNRTRTYDLLCVREFLRLSTMSIPYRWC
jgi:hypothetical protein